MSYPATASSNATVSTVTPSTPNPEKPQQRQTAKEIIAANIKELIAQLEAGRICGAR
jgi:hypothetical protein